jgi:hypothetical protein
MQETQSRPRTRGPAAIPHAAIAVQQMLLYEMGRCPLQISWLARVVRYWNKRVAEVAPRVPGWGYGRPARVARPNRQLVNPSILCQCLPWHYQGEYKRGGHARLPPASTRCCWVQHLAADPDTALKAISSPFLRRSIRYKLLTWHNDRLPTNMRGGSA